MTPEKRTAKLLKEGFTPVYVETLMASATAEGIPFKSYLLINKKPVSDLLFLADRWGIVEPTSKKTLLTEG
jgi:hypothetical protein